MLSYDKKQYLVRDQKSSTLPETEEFTDNNTTDTDDKSAKKEVKNRRIRTE